MYLITPEMKAAIYDCFDRGLNLRATARATGAAVMTVSRYYHEKPPMLCLCGKPLTHRGWCSHRVALSPGRQAFLRRFVVIKPQTLQRWGTARECAPSPEPTEEPTEEVQADPKRITDALITTGVSRRTVVGKCSTPGCRFTSQPGRGLCAGCLRKKFVRSRGRSCQIIGLLLPVGS